MESKEKKLTLFLLCLIFGWFGLHCFHVGKYVTGVLMLATFGGLGVWTLIDLALITMGRFTDRGGLRVTQWV